MILYQGGPMRGYPLYNFNEMELGKLYLEYVLGHIVISPHDVDIECGATEVQYEYRHLPIGAAYVPFRHFTEVTWLEDDLSACLRRDIPIVAECDAVSFLPGWQESEGCSIERQVAEWCGLDIYEHKPFEYFHTASISESILTPDRLGF